MALLTYADRVAETTTTTGTGTIQLGGAVDGKFRTFVAGAGSGNTVPYVMVHRTANEWEVGYGVVTSGSPDTLTRAGVYSSSNGGSAVTFSAGTKDVFLGLPAGKTVTFDDTTGAVTLSSLTVSGGLTVDTTTLVVDATNNRVGVGTASPAVPLDVGGAARFDSAGNWMQFGSNVLTSNATSGAHIRSVITDATAPTFSLAGDTDTGIYFPAANVLGFTTGGVERARIDANGNVGIGVTPSAWLSSQKALEVSGWSVNAASTTSSLATNAYVDAGSTWRYKATGFAGRYDNVSGEHQWYTAASGTAGNAITFTERARITAGGYFKASNDGTYVSSTGTYHELRGNAAATPAAVVHSTNAAFTSAVLDVLATNTGTGFSFIRCLDGAGANIRLSVRGDGDVANQNGVYGTLSDAKLKQDITDANSQWDDLKAIRFRKYRFTSDVEQKGEDAPYLLGVVAQELRETSPGLVDAHPDTEQVEVEVEVEKSRPVLDEDGQPVMGEDGEPLTEAYTETETRTETRPTGTETLSVKQSILLMKAAVALQEAMARIETLEARLAALEAK